MNHRLPFQAKLIAAVAAATLLAACGRDESQTVGQQVDESIAKAEQRTEAAQAEARQEIDEAKSEASAAADRMAHSAEKAGDRIASKVEDATITASVNAELAKDPALSALRINVDTSNGRVLLRGTAPDAAARDRATQLATAIDGVVAVDNQLEVRS